MNRYSRKLGPASNKIRRRPSKAKRAQAAPDEWLDARLNYCQMCQRPEQRHMALHHVVYRQHVEAAGGDMWDVRNGMTLCAGPYSCHSRHHSRIRVIPVTMLPHAAIEYAVELFGGPAAFAYLTRYYLGKDLRVDLLLRDEAA